MGVPSDSIFSTLPLFRWVPIRSLGERHRDRVLTHLLALEPHDRYLRFGYSPTDAQVARYVDMLDFERDEIFGIFNRRLELIAMAHLAYLPETATEPAMAEFGVSVVPKARGRGYGSRLFDHAVLHARNRQVNTMIIHALSENTAMLRIVRTAGATLVRDGSEAEARLTLPPETFASHIEALVEGQAAEFDYQMKTHARRVEAMGEVLANTQAQLHKVRRDFSD